ncbi:cytochrome P450 [Archangium minus]|uniref:Cytochrome P450 n=1 Tax=Archangium minus TaxID=83450 RepID=A0ABY9WQW4_9BACT|nr:cytochrome P450 [Archangium minus]
MPDILNLRPVANALASRLPVAIIGLRNRIFTRINGEEGIPIPGERVDVSHFKELYSNPAADGRSDGAALSDLFWYWLSPGAEIHQEHLEPGERYEEVAQTTRRILSLPKKTAEELAARCTVRVLEERAIHRATLVRLRDLMMPIWAEFYYELVFNEQCPREARDLIVGNANDVVTALKGLSLRHMDRRLRLTRYLKARLQAGAVAHELPSCLSLEQKAFYLQGVYFNTAVVQMSEAMAHLVMFLAQNQEIQARLADNLEDDRYLDRIITESLRLYPLFGIAHRITSSDIRVDDKTTLPKGSVLCFNYQAYHHEGFEDPLRFDPDRWLKHSTKESNYMPFGAAANRPCPAQAIALVTMRAVARETIRRFSVFSTASHTRPLPNRGPCVLEPRKGNPEPRLREELLASMSAREPWEEVGRSVLQLVLGTYMVLDAKRLRLCQRYFEAERQASASTAGAKASRCPFSPT